jgi:pro-apoptotic serine protease NMA111
MVRKVDSGYAGALQESDIILTLNGQLITRIAALDIQYAHEELNAVIVRRREQISLKAPTVPTQDLETTRAVLFCGAVLHRPHHAVRQQISKIHSDVYISGRQRGSPAYAYGLSPTNFITHVNGFPTLNLDDFLREVKKIPDNTYFRLKVMTFDNVPWVATMKKCEHYFPTLEFVKDPAEAIGWRRVVHEADASGQHGLVPGGVEVEGGGGAAAAEEPEGGGARA